MKKLFLFICIFLSFNLSACITNDPRYINFSKKPANNYYSTELLNKFNSNADYCIYIFDTNLYKNIKVNDNEKVTVQQFCQNLKNENFLDSFNSNSKELFRVKIAFQDNSIYLIKVFDSENISISPWDGTYNEDFIKMDNIPLQYNLYDFCSHIHGLSN